MRVLHVNKFLYRRGGAESYLLDVAAMQARHGHEVALFGMDHPQNLPDLELADLFPSHVELDPAPSGAAGVRAAARMVWSTSARRGMAAALERFRPDVVHCHNIYHQLSPSVLEPVRRAGVRCVMTLHDYKLACPSYQMLDRGRPCDACVRGGPMQAVRRRCRSGSLAASGLLSLESSLHRVAGAYDGVDVLVSPSRFLADVMVRAGVAGDRLRVVNHFVEPSAAQASASAPRQRDVVVAGRLSPEKGVDVLVRAAGLSVDVPHVHVAGEGPERSALEELAARVAPGRVTFHGRLDKAALADLVAASLATVVPSRWYENQPMTVLESYAAGVPAVVTGLGGLPELVRDGVDGVVVAPEDPPALAAALVGLADDPAAAARMGRAGRVRLLAGFDPGLHLRRLEAAYRGEPDPVGESGGDRVDGDRVDGDRVDGGWADAGRAGAEGAGAADG